MKASPLKSRSARLNALTAEPLDVLIIGGGIVGAGIARDAAMRGLRTGLVEQHDFAFGTSSRSSRLLHGGLRYLAQGRVGLVHEASVEKKIIHHIAPHLAEPLPFLFPTYRGNRNWVLWQLKIGVKIYDLLCGGRNLGKSTWLNARELLAKVPALTPDQLNGAVRYFDGFTNDARLTLDTLRSAANHGALVLNYCRFQDAARLDNSTPSLTRALPGNVGSGTPTLVGSPSDTSVTLPAEAGDPIQGGNARILRGKLAPSEAERDGVRGRPANSDPLWSCEIRDRLTDKTFTVRARAVVNATGPWADGLPHSRVKLRVTKGIHLVVERARVPVPETVVMTEGKRILFAIPWGERTILGTTDTDYDGPLDQVVADAADIDYVLRITNQFFPAARLKPADVISHWAGLRPLVADPNGKPSDISRSHEIRQSEPGWWDVTGGKLTTYRLMAEQAVDGIVKAFKATGSWKRTIPACRTASERLLPAAQTEGVSSILPPAFSRTAVEHYCAHEWAVHLDDIMLRRTSWHYYSPDAAAQARQVADWMGELQDWSAATRAAELERYQQAMSCPPATVANTTTASAPRHDQPALSVV